jgi:hypothetical protein
MLNTHFFLGKHRNYEDISTGIDDIKGPFWSLFVGDALSLEQQETDLPPVQGIKFHPKGHYK